MYDLSVGYVLIFVVGAGKNATHGPTKDLRKVEDETEDFHRMSVLSCLKTCLFCADKGVDLDMRLKIQQARMAKQMTQKDLANVLSFARLNLTLTGDSRKTVSR